MLISVVVPTHNRSDTLRICLEALLQQDYAPFEVIVVDDCSTDGTEEVVKEEFPTIHYIRLAANKGPAAARNVGIAHSQGEVVAFTDDDCVVPPDWLSRIEDGYKRFPKVAGVGGFLEAPPETLSINILARYERSIGKTHYGAGLQEVVGGFDCPAGGTNNMSYRISALRRVGGFDESFPFAAGEDADLKLRITQEGAQLLYLPIKVLHLHHYSWDRFRKQGIIRGRGVVHFERKHHGAPPTLARIALRFLKRIVLFVKNILLGPQRPLAFPALFVGVWDCYGQILERSRIARES